MKRQVKRNLDKALEDANNTGSLMWGFIVSPEDGSIGTFCNQQLNLDSILFNTANACKELSDKHDAIAVGNA